MRRSALMSVLILLSAVTARNLVPDRYRLSLQTDRRDSTYAGLTSNVISELKLQGDSLTWLGTGLGLALIGDSLVVETFYTRSGLSDGDTTRLLPEGGVAAIAVAGDTILAAMAGTEKGTATGYGLVLTDSSHTSWTYFGQPLDGPGDSLVSWLTAPDRYFRALPVTVSQANVTYDAVIAGRYAWIASWAGGLRRYDFTNPSRGWQRVPLPPDGVAGLNTCQDSLYNDTTGVLKNFYLNPRDPGPGGGNHNHKAFSVLAYGDTVWVGTANGLNRGILGAGGCIDWKHYFFPSDGLSGNWVVGLARQDWNGRRIIWAVTLNTEGPEKRGLSYTTNDGLSWQATLLGERGYNIIAADSLLFAATENGLWRSHDGENWALYRPARQALWDTTTQVYLTDEITTNEVYTAAFDRTHRVLWIGTGDGLARSADLDGLNWTIFRTQIEGVYAYPNPFKSGLDGDRFVRFHTAVQESFVIRMDIYNFALERVYHEEFDRRLAGAGTLKWDGRDLNGRAVANGTYFVRLNYDVRDHWIKLIVIK